MPDAVPAQLTVREPGGCGNAPRTQIIQDFVVALLSKDLNQLRQRLSSEVQWQLVGFQHLNGLSEVLEWVQGARDSTAVTFHSIITHGRLGSADGEVTNIRNVTVAFSHVITFDGAAKSAKIKEIRSYLVSTPIGPRQWA